MSEKINQNSPNQTSDWDMLTQLAAEHASEPTAAPEPLERGASRAFKHEAAEHQANAEHAMDRMSTAQREALGRAGIRDAQDAGEYLHEAASWSKQVDKAVSSIDTGISGDEHRLQELARYNNVDPVSGEHLGDSPFTTSSNPDADKKYREDFQWYQEENNINKNSLSARAVSDLIRDELQLETPETSTDQSEPPEPHSRAALDAEALARWKSQIKSDPEALKQLQDSAYYATLKRIIEREAANDSDSSPESQ